MAEKVTRLDKQQIAHMLRAAAGVTGRTSFVMIGTGAVIAQKKTLALDLMRTRAIDIYVIDSDEADQISDLIDGSIGEGSPFDATFGYYAHGVSERTACLPGDWASRAVRFDVPGTDGVVCICPDADDIALSKLCAWRDKDIAWLVAGLTTGLLNLAAMRNRAGNISNSNAPAPAEQARRLDHLARIYQGSSAQSSD